MVDDIIDRLAAVKLSETTSLCIDRKYVSCCESIFYVKLYFKVLAQTLSMMEALKLKVLANIVSMMTGVNLSEITSPCKDCKYHGWC